MLSEYLRSNEKNKLKLLKLCPIMVIQFLESRLVPILGTLWSLLSCLTHRSEYIVGSFAFQRQAGVCSLLVDGKAFFIHSAVPGQLLVPSRVSGASCYVETSEHFMYDRLAPS